MQPHPDTFLRRRREQRALSADEMARRLGVHPNSVLRWERRERLPAPTHIRALAHWLELDTAAVAAFFDDARPAAGPARPTIRGQGLRPLRRAARVPARAIADGLGVHPAAVYNWEAGRARIPLTHVPRLAELLDLETARLRALLVAGPASLVDRPPRSSALQRLRQSTGLSRTDVARRIGATRHAVGSWERGTRPPLAALRRLAGVYGVPVALVAKAAGVTAPPLLDLRRWTRGDLPEVLVVLRRWSGLTQGQVASQCECSISSVRAWERGRGVPQPAFRARIEGVYGLPAGALLTAFPHQD